MSDKYYTPELGEFHYGFEYEIFEDFDHYPEKSWHLQLYGINGTSPEDLDYVSGDMSKFRVKYLDREDIESLGFEKVECPDGLFNNVFQLITTYETKYVLNLYMNIDKRIGFTQIVERFRHEGKNREYVGERGNKFKGTIKNKSELKKVLKMIGV